MLLLGKRAATKRMQLLLPGDKQLLTGCNVRLPRDARHVDGRELLTGHSAADRVLHGVKHLYRRLYVELTVVSA